MIRNRICSLSACVLVLLACLPCLAKQPQLSKTTAALQSGKQTVRVVCFGDSVTGLYYHTGGLRAYTDMVGIALRRAYPNAKVEAINAGVSGHTTRNALARIERDVLARRPTLVTVMFGLNDMVRVPIEEYEKNLETIVAKCRAIGAEVLLCTPNSVTDTPGRPTKKLIAYCQAVRRVAKEQNVALCDCYRAYEKIRARDSLTWRLLMSDAIHPNMDGHKQIATEIVHAVSGKRIDPADVAPPRPALAKTVSLLKAGKPVSILAMPPWDKQIAPALKSIYPEAQLQVTPWPTEGKTLAKIEQDAKSRVRKMKPNLVLIAVPRSAKAKSQEEFIHAYAWIMNWSLSFGRQQWDVLVIHPAVDDAKTTDPQHDQLVRRLVRAQDLHLIDRPLGHTATAVEILSQWLREHNN